MAYFSLREKSRYLREVTTAGQGKSLRPDEITTCEEYADSLIEGRLGKSWVSGAVPKMIEHIADLLGSSKAYNFLQTGQTTEESGYARSLREEAFDLLDKIAGGEIGLKLPDGSWDEDYPGMAGAEATDSGNFEILA